MYTVLVISGMEALPVNNFTIVFDVIKQQCCEASDFVSASCIEYIREALKDRVCLSVDFYLDTLLNTGLIRYDKATQQITLTEKGLHTEALFI